MEPPSLNVHRVWMYPGVRLAAGLCGALAVFVLATGGSWVADTWADLTDPGPRRTSEAINAVFDKVLSERDWIAAGLPGGHTEFEVFRFPAGATSYKSARRLGTKDEMRGWFFLSIGTEEGVRNRRRTFLEREHEGCHKLGEGVETGADDPARCWYVFARCFNADTQQYRHLIGLCFHDGVYVRVDFDDWVTKEQAAGFQRLVQGASDRLSGVCEADLRPYVERTAKGRR